MKCAATIIDKLGGTRKAARLLGRPHSTVQSWKKSGFIPARAQADVIRKSEGAVTPNDFYDLPEIQPEQSSEAA